MARNLPYFQFEPAEYMTGTIQFCSLEAQGLYVNIQCLYWQRECKMTKEALYRKFESHSKLIDELFQENIIKLDGEHLVIEFLNNQFDVISRRKKVLSDNGKKGAKVSNAMRVKTVGETIQAVEIQKNVTEENKITRPAVEGVFFYVGMTLYRHKVSLYVVNEMQITINSFMPSMQPINTEQVLKQMDIEYTGTTFKDHNHVVNSFKSVARQLKSPNKYQKPVVDAGSRQKIKFG